MNHGSFGKMIFNKPNGQWCYGPGQLRAWPAGALRRGAGPATYALSGARQC
jgi:hypothetical protein